MKRQTRKLVLNIAAGLAVASAAAVVSLPAAHAAPAQITNNVNVRSGPGTNFPVVDSLRRGASVDVGRCQASYCQIRTRNGGGWVSQSYLSNGSAPVAPGGIGITIGPNGPSVSIGGNNPPPVADDEEDEAQVCLYDRSRFRGQSTCLSQGERIRDLGDFAERASSIDNPDNLRIEVCGESNFRDCRTYTSSASTLGDFDDYIVSARVR